MGIFDDYHTISEWEKAIESDGRFEFYAIYYVIGKKVLDHVLGWVNIIGKNGKPIRKFVTWHAGGNCFEGKERKPEYDIIFKPNA